ncbi:MAG TPA: glycosyltransferase, partial [Candidatus Hydrogenedentes bacterium]|nr:glycosyltransferase [Candidatus Hydrogenedentota bacterium]
SEAREYIQFAGFVPEEDLPGLISGADVLALVSLWEGFGLPALEAMACGTAVVVSDCSSLPEVTGDAGMLVDPYEEAAIAAAIEQVLLNEDLRGGLETRGLERAATFTWKRTAETVLEALEQAVARRRRNPCPE